MPADPQPDLDRLEALARKATSGPWRNGFPSQAPIAPHSWTWATGTCDVYQDGDPSRWPPPIARSGDQIGGPDEIPGGIQRDEDAAYIAAASPEVVLQLIARIRELETMRRTMDAEREAALKIDPFDDDLYQSTVDHGHWYSFPEMFHLGFDAGRASLLPNAVYILEGKMDYEGTLIDSVFSSADRAKQAHAVEHPYDQWIADGDSWVTVHADMHAYYTLTRWTVDAPADAPI